MMAIIDDLLHPWREARDAEKAAAEKRRELEGQIIALLFPDVAPDFEGTLKADTDSGAEVKVAYKMSRKVDLAAANRIALQMGAPHLLPLVFREKLDWSATGWKQHGDAARPLLQAVTATPARPAITINWS
jgi:hypothetical protein